jgi:hypothetical protein
MFPPQPLKVKFPEPTSVAFVLIRKDRNLRMESIAGRDGNRLDVVVLAHALRALLAQAGPNAVNVCKDERLTRPAPDQGVEDNRLEE